MRRLLPSLLLLALLPGGLQAQNEAALRRAFEGQSVVVKIDMPGTSSGVNVFPSQDRPVDFPDVAEKLKRYGTALRTGDAVMVTKVKVKDDLIEFQLGGGGYGTFGDDMGNSGGGSYDQVGETNAEKALRDLPAKMDTQVHTDYNLDDKEIGLGGWASHADKKMHLLLEVAQVKDEKKTKAILIHEASHFGTATVKDHVYYNQAGFFELDEAKKVANAAHYEELPRRVMGTSSFDKKTFVPGTKPGGGAVTKEDQIKAAANLYIRKAWDAGVSAHKFLRAVHRESLAGNKKPFDDNKTLILEMSKLMDLTIHEQAAGKEMVTPLDVTLMESVARGVYLIVKLSASVPFPAAGTLTDVQLRDKIIAEAVKMHDNLLKDPARDKKLLDWLEAHYKTFPKV